ncbi:DNA polymerase theta-like [Periplaneta americana]|uniref:DNA polymerase theta-like n=1 Tax=Periplaneta americana TaxID=6978 RepID=UPI0037E940C1
MVEKEVDSTNRKTNLSVEEVSLLCTQEKNKLASWGLPEGILKRYEASGIVNMFPWQVECLCNPRVLEGGNLIYSAPTSAGKTLVAEILTIKTVLEKKKKVIVILPFVSVVREKMFYFQDLLSSSGVRVAGLMGSHSLPGGFKSVDIAICTIEKANSLVNRLLEEGSLYKVGAVVVDELHLLGDPFRGYLLELLLTKILYMCSMKKSVKIQVVGMSATLPNLSLLATWLGADLYRTDFRPIPLKEFLKVGPTVYDNQMKKLYDMKPSKFIQDDPDHVVQLCLDTLLHGHSVLVFCATKQWCEKLAQHIAQVFRKIGFSGSEMSSQIREQLNSDAIAEALELLKRCPVGLDKVLQCTVAFGVAFHHAGLTLDERDIIEGCFRSGTLRVLVATSTLSSGVNLPARRVIVRSPVFHGKSLDPQTYRQMIGRAGRMGRDTAGESFLLCHKGEGHIGEKLVGADLKPIESCLGHGELAASLKRAILEVIASGVASTPEEVTQYTNCTLLSTNKSSLQNPVSSCVKFLEDNELIRLQKEDNGEGHKYIPTPLGLACLAASLPPDDGLLLFDELQRARQCFVLDTELHVIYEVTPYSVCSQWGNLDWLHVLNLWEQLPAAMRRVGELVGVEERFMVRAMRGTLSLNTGKQIKKMSIHRRFYTALALHDLVNEVPLADVAKKFGCSRGMLQSLQQSAATFAGMVTAFCRRLGWSSVELLVSQFQDRLQFGVQRELIDLMRLDTLNGPRARALFDEGITSLADLAAADVCTVENTLHTAVPFQSCKELNGETSFDTKQRNKLRNVWITGRQGITEREAASMLISDARSFLQKELGLVDAKWDCQESDSSGYESPSLSVQNSVSEIHPMQKSKKEIPPPNQLPSYIQSKPMDSSPDHINFENKCSSHSTPSEDKEKKLTKRRSSLISDEDCLSSSPISSFINTKTSHKDKSRRIRSRLGKKKQSKRGNMNGRVRKTKQRAVLKKSESLTTDESPDIVCNKTKNSQYETTNCSHSKKVVSLPQDESNISETSICEEQNKGDQNILSLSPALLETSSNVTCSESTTKDLTMDYFGSPIEISDSKIHEKTQRLENITNAIISKEEIGENSTGREATSNINDSKNQFRKNFLSSLIMPESTSKEGNEQIDIIDNVNVNISQCNVNNMQKDILRECGNDSNKNTNTPPKICQNTQNMAQETVDTCTNKRQYDVVDLVSTPSEEKCTEINSQSQNLFGESLVVDTQLDKVLGVCYDTNETREKGKNIPQFPIENDFIDKHISPSDQQSYEENYNGKISHVIAENGTSKLVTHNSLCFKSSESILECMKNEAKGNSTEITEEGNVSFMNHKLLHDFPVGIVTARDVMKWESNRKLDSLHLKAGKAFDSDSMRKSEGLSYDSIGNEFSVDHSVNSEEIIFHSFAEQTTMPCIESSFEIKKGLISPPIYNLKSSLLLKSQKSKKSTGKSLNKKRKISVTSDSSYSENRFRNCKRKRVSNEISTNMIEDEGSFEDKTESSDFKMVNENKSIMKLHVNKDSELPGDCNYSENKFISAKRKRVADLTPANLVVQEGASFEDKIKCPDIKVENIGIIFNKESPKELCVNNYKLPSDSNYSENEFINSKEKRISNEIFTDTIVEGETNFEDKMESRDLQIESNEIVPSKSKRLKKLSADKNGEFQNEKLRVIGIDQLHMEEPEINDKPVDENDEVMTDSFFEKAFNTYWELSSDSEENHDKKDKQNVDANSSHIENILPIASEVAVKCDKSNSREVKLEDDQELTKNAGDVQSPCLFSDSLLEGAFNSCWEEEPGCKSSTADAEEKQSPNNNLRDKLSVVDVNGDGDTNSTIDGKVLPSLTTSSNCRRKSPRLLAAQQNKENKDSQRNLSEVTTRRQTSKVLSENVSVISGENSKVKARPVITSKNLRLEPTVPSHLANRCDQSPSKGQRERLMEVKEKISPFCSNAKTPFLKESNTNSSTVSKATRANKILQFASDSSDEEAEDDLITSSQGDDETGKKRTLEGVRMRLSERDLRSASRSPTHSHQKKNVPTKNTRNNEDKKKKKNKDTAKRSMTWDSINIVDVCGHERVWTSFQSELKSACSSKMALAVACEQFSSSGASGSTNKPSIGARIIGIKAKKSENTVKEKVMHYGQQLVSGVALCFGGRDVFYISLKNDDRSCVNVQCKLSLIQDLLDGKQLVCAFDLKEHLKALARCCGIRVNLSTGHDPKVADWLMEPEGREKNLHAMALTYGGNEASKLADLAGSGWGTGSTALDWRSTTSSRLRACTEAVLTWHVVEACCVCLEQKELYHIYSDVEMPTLLCLTRMELNGIGFSRDEAEKLRDLLEKQLSALEQYAYKLAGHTFSLTSSADVGKVLYRELGLTAGKQSSKQRRPSTSKDALLRIKSQHPLPAVILQWRKLNAIVTKTLFPLLTPAQSTARMFTSSVIHTATGRISMHEPNLQNIPRDFDIIIDKTRPEASSKSISMRVAFVPSAGKVFVSADYCQLELRLLAHLAKDDTLCSVLNAGGDVFRKIAASWNFVSESEVTGEQRQWAKQVCYGMIYGMGAKALGEQLEVEEEDAAVFMDTFKNAYPGVKKFLSETVLHCRKEGYIETLFGRRRYLPTIHSSHAAVRAQAERQAVNSTVQGSAADIAKRAMVLVESQLRGAGFSCSNTEQTAVAQKVASLTLHIHDELLYEVSQNHAIEAAAIIKSALENAVNLSVQLPVKVKVGESWGSLKEITELNTT